MKDEGEAARRVSFRSSFRVRLHPSAFILLPPSAFIPRAALTVSFFWHSCFFAEGRASGGEACATNAVRKDGENGRNVSGMQ
jgi:hypothetical protein